MSDDPHAPTNAGPDPQEGQEPTTEQPAPETAAASGETPAPEPAPAAAAQPEPTPVVPPSEASWRTPPGSAAPASAAGGDRPEVEVGLAFAGGVAAALLLKVISR